MSSLQATEMQGRFDERVGITGGSADSASRWRKHSFAMARGRRQSGGMRRGWPPRVRRRRDYRRQCNGRGAHDGIVADEQPDILILNASARLPMGPIDRAHGCGGEPSAEAHVGSCARVLAIESSRSCSLLRSIDLRGRLVKT